MSGIVVIGATGGCGVTTFACAVALVHAAAGTAPLLADLDPHGGGPVDLWGIPATRALDDLLDLGDKVRAHHVDHLVHRHMAGVDVMAGSRASMCGAGWSQPALDALAERVAASPCWVADAGRGNTAPAQALTAHADTVVVLVPRTVHGTRRASALPAMAGRSVLPVATDLPAGERVSDRVLSRALGIDVVATAPRDDRAAARVADAQAPTGRGLARAVTTVAGLS